MTNGDNELSAFIKKEFDKFIKLCPQGQDPVLSILRLHLLSEYYMERIFHLLMPRGDKVADTSLSYAQKLGILEALGALDDRELQCLKNLNRVRNGCAHEFNKTITSADCDLIGRPLGKEYTALHRKHAGDDLLWEVLGAVCGNLVSTVWALEQSQLKESKQKTV